MKRDLESLLAQLREGKGPSLLLLHGDDFKVRTATKTILDLLLPPVNRAFNLESFNGQTAPWDQIDVALMTPSLFASAKTVLIDNAPYFLSREHKGELGEKILALWSEGNKEAAGGLFAQLLSLESWTRERWQAFSGSFSATELDELFGDDGKETRDAATELAQFCQSRGIELRQAKEGEEQRLQEFLEQGLPPWAKLLITTPHVDRRLRLYKRFEEKGCVLDLSVERDRTGRISRENLVEFVDQRLKEAGKKIEAQAREMILTRAGDELWAVHQELEKLLLYVGDAPWIKTRDVEEVFLDYGEGWVFDLTGAIAERNSLLALSHLERLLSQGEHPLRLLATIASDVRRLLTARTLIEGELRQRWVKNMSYDKFQASVLREGATLLTRNPYGDYMTFKKAENFTTPELVHHLQWIYQSDLRLKSSHHTPRIVMERLILEMCQRT